MDYGTPNMALWRTRRARCSRKHRAHRAFAQIIRVRTTLGAILRIQIDVATLTTVFLLATLLVACVILRGCRGVCLLCLLSPRSACGSLGSVCLRPSTLRLL